MIEYRSAEIDKIMGALAKAQGSYKPLVANEDAPGGKYANLAAIMSATRESLASNSIGFYQHLEITDEGTSFAILKTYIGHESGQFICSVTRVVPAATDRGTANRIEILKRIHALMILGIAPSQNDPYAFDDNGQELGTVKVLEDLKKPKEQKTINRNDVINSEQYNDILIELKGYEEIAKDIMTTYQIETLADIPREEYYKTRNRILRIKAAHDEYNQRHSNG